MRDAGFTRHARKRLQQRGIPPLLIDVLDQFGSVMRCGGAERVFFDKAAKRRLRTHPDGRRILQIAERWLRVYAVVGDDGFVVTVAHQHRRFRRPR